MTLHACCCIDAADGRPATTPAGARARVWVSSTPPVFASNGKLLVVSPLGPWCVSDTVLHWACCHVAFGVNSQLCLALTVGLRLQMLPATRHAHVNNACRKTQCQHVQFKLCPHPPPSLLPSGPTPQFLVTPAGPRRLPAAAWPAPPPLQQRPHIPHHWQDPGRQQPHPRTCGLTGSSLCRLCRKSTVHPRTRAPTPQGHPHLVRQQI
jgi:hypothetical protein